MILSVAELNEQLAGLLAEACRREKVDPPSLLVKRGFFRAQREADSGEWLSVSYDPTPYAAICRLGSGRTALGAKTDTYRVWRRSTSGCAYYNRDLITLKVGHDPVDRHGVLIHELAHIICWRRWKDPNHSRRFWLTCRRLYIAAGMDPDERLQRDATCYARAARYISAEKVSV